MEILLSSFGVGLLLLCKGVPLSLVYISSETPLGKSNSTFASGCQLETASRLRIGAHINSPLSVMGLGVFCHNLCDFISNHCKWKILFPSCHTSPVTLTVLLLELPYNYMNL